MKKELIIALSLLLMPLYAFTQNKTQVDDLRAPFSGLIHLRQKTLQNEKKNYYGQDPGRSDQLVKTFLLNKTSGNKQVLDSLITQNRDEISGEWIDEYKSKFSYYENWNLKQYLDLFWDNNTGEWINEYKTDYTYDVVGRTTLILYHNWDVDITNWVNSYKEEFTYNAQGKMSQSFEYDWDNNARKWVGSAKSEYTYNPGGLLTQTFYYDRDDLTSDWLYSYKEEISYNTEGKKIVSTFSDWNEAEDNWIESFKTEYTYNAEGKVEQTLGLVRIDAPEDWILMTKDDYSYNENGNLILLVSQFWEENSGKWIQSNKNEYAYDASGNMIRYIDYDFDGLNELFPFFKEEYTYNDTYTLDDLIIPSEFIYFDESIILFNHMLTSATFQEWDLDLSKWGNPEKGTLYYSDQIATSLKDIGEISVSLYPNPVSEDLSLRHDGVNKITFTLFNLQGHVIMTREIDNNGKINLDGLREGIYIYSLIIDGKRQNGKLIKK